MNESATDNRTADTQSPKGLDMNPDELFAGARAYVEQMPPGIDRQRALALVSGAEALFHLFEVRQLESPPLTYRDGLKVEVRGKELLALYVDIGKGAVAEFIDPDDRFIVPIHELDDLLRFAAHERASREARQAESPQSARTDS